MCVLADFFCVTGEIYKFFKQIWQLILNQEIEATVWNNNLVKTEVSVALEMILSMDHP